MKKRGSIDAFRFARHNRVRRNYKDHLFIRLFREKEDLLSLYNALNHTSYDNPEELTITTLEDVVYLGRKNDVSFMIGSYVNLYEHQSTFCPNMPLRGFLYLAEFYQGYLSSNELNLYGERQLQLPTPKYVVFYNGEKKRADVETLRLTDSFPEPIDACLECAATVYNINAGHNEAILKQCKKLEGYSVFVSKVREYMKTGKNLRAATELAISYCITHDYIKDFLLKQQAEVTRMILTEYNPKKQRQLDLRDAREAGREEGISLGLEQGISLGREQGLERGLEQGRAQGLKRGISQGRSNTLRIFLDNGGTKEQAKQLLNATEEELAALAALPSDELDQP